MYIYIYSCSDIVSLLQEQTSLPKSCLCCRFSIKKSLKMTYLKMLIGIKYLPKDRVIYDCCLSLCL